MMRVEFDDLPVQFTAAHDAAVAMLGLVSAYDGQPITSDRSLSRK